MIDINKQTPKMRPHTQLVNIDASWEKGHNWVIFSARNKFLYFIMLKIQQGIQWYHQILYFIAPLLRKRQRHSRTCFVGHPVYQIETFIELWLNSDA